MDQTGPYRRERKLLELLYTEQEGDLPSVAPLVCHITSGRRRIYDAIL